jgi:hypothetical protein
MMCNVNKQKTHDDMTGTTNSGLISTFSIKPMEDHCYIDKTTGQKTTSIQMLSIMHQNNSKF